MIGYGKRVLVVDDEEPVRHLLTEQLEEHEFVVVAVADGLRALTELHRRHFDAVITDLQMPHLDGLDLLRRWHLAWPQLPVILISSHLVDEIVDLAMTHGAVACLPKPVDPGNLLHVLSEVIAVKPVELRSPWRDPTPTSWRKERSICVSSD